MVALAILSSVSTVIIAWNLSVFVTQIFIEGSSVSDEISSLWFVFGAGALRATLIWFQEMLSQRAASSVKNELRGKYLAAVIKLGPGWLAHRRTAEINNNATVGLDALDAYFSKYLPQLVYTALVTPAFIILISIADIASGVVVLLTIPLIPLFMILIGWATKSVQQKQLVALNRLTGHFLEVMRGLTTLKIFGRAQAQVQKMAEISDQHRKRTMKVLRISFLSGFALELLASLSVALIAVSIGLRLVNGDIALLIGLFVLIIAPEAYLPIRQVGVNFHAAAEGVAVSSAVLDTIDLAANCEAPKPGRPNHGDLHFDAGELSVLVGPSGSGKTTCLRELIGIDGPQQNPRIMNSSWLPQQTTLVAGTIESNVVGPAETDMEVLLEAMRFAALDDLTHELELGPAGAGISGGQAQRIALARAFYRALKNRTQLLVLDEPTSALDAGRAAKVVESLAWFAKDGFTVVAASHDLRLIAAADRVVEVQSG